MKHFEEHLDHAREGLARAMDRAGFDPSAVTVGHAFLGRRHSEPTGILVYGEPKHRETVQRAAQWLKAWGDKHGMIKHGHGQIFTGERLDREHVHKGPVFGVNHPGVARAFVVFDVVPFD